MTGQIKLTVFKAFILYDKGYIHHAFQSKFVEVNSFKCKDYCNMATKVKFCTVLVIHNVSL